MTRSIALLTVTLLALLAQENAAFVVTKPTTAAPSLAGVRHQETQLNLFRRFRQQNHQDADSDAPVPSSKLSRGRRLRRKLGAAVLAASLAMASVKTEPAHAGVKVAVTRGGISISTANPHAMVNPDLVPATVGDALTESMEERQTAALAVTGGEQIVELGTPEGYDVKESVVVQTEMTEKTKIICGVVGAAAVVGGQALIVKKIHDDEVFLENLDREIARLEDESDFVENMLQMDASFDEPTEEPPAVHIEGEPKMTSKTDLEKEADLILMEAESKLEQSLKELKEIEHMADNVPTTFGLERVNGEQQHVVRETSSSS